MNSYSPSFDVFFGGLITFLVALFGVWAERKHARKEREKERLEVLSATGFSLQMKIATAHGWLNSTKASIDECFSDVAIGRFSDLDPGVKVKPLVGAACPEIDFSPQELALLLSAGDSGLVEKILSFQWNTRTTGALVAAFNVSRLDYSRFIADRAVAGEWDGAAASVSMPIETEHARDARLAELNTLIAQILEQLEAGLAESKVLNRRVQSSLNSVDNLTIKKVELV